MFDNTFSDNASDFESRNDDTKSMRDNNFSVKGFNENNPLTTTTGEKTTTNSTDQKSDGGMISKYVWIAAAAAGAYMLFSKKGRSSGRGLALR